MTKSLIFKKEEWFSLVALVFVLTSLLVVLQRYHAKEISIQGEPSFETSIDLNGGLRNPLSVATYKDKIVATSSSDSKIKLFDIKGKELHSIVLPAKAYPASLAVKDDGTLFIGDLTSKAIYKSSMEHNLRDIEKVKIKNPVQPLALTIHRGSLLFFDGVSQRLKLVKDDLTLVDFVKSKKISLNYANGLHSTGSEVFVADSNSRRIIRFDGNGNYQATLKNFSLPRGIAIDSLGRLHVVDTFVHTIKVYSPSGTELFSYGTEGTARDQLYFPNDIAIDSKNGKAYIADKGNNRVQVWSW